MGTSGARLKQIRLEKGLTLEEAQKKTKIHLNILRAIEEGSFSEINPTYLKGFLKIYCSYLGVDPKEMLSTSQQPRPSEPVLSKKESSGGSPVIKLRSFSKARESVIIAIVVIVLVFGLFNLGRFISSRRRLQKVNREQLIPLIDKTIKAKPSPVKVQRAQVTAQVAKKQPQQGAPKEKILLIKLGMRAKEDCWLDLKLDGKVVFHSVLKKGKFESWQARDRIEFSTNNAAALELELNNKPIPSLGRKGQAIKNVCITKEEGLVVGR